MAKFKTGEYVYHRTNDDVKMLVVDDVDASDSKDLYHEKRECSWIDKKGRYHYETFYAFELKY